MNILRTVLSENKKRTARSFTIPLKSCREETIFLNKISQMLLGTPGSQELARDKNSSK
jgi:hypothetical protein